MMTTTIHSAAAVAVDDHRRLYVRLSVPNSDGNAYEQYLFDISSSQNKEKENIYFPRFDGDCFGGCCGGLLCLHHILGKTVILNPFRREFKFLPPGLERPAGTNYSYYRACGLGFDSQSNDYKVVRFVTNYCEGVDDMGHIRLIGILDSQVELYSLKHNSWKEILGPKVRVENCGIYVNNKCYWISYSPFSVISFNFEKESLSSFIPLPKALPTMHSSTDDVDVFDGLRIFEYIGSLAAIGYKKSGLCTLFEAYTLKEQEQEQEEEYQWQKKFTVKVFGDHKPLGFGENGRSLFLQGNNAKDKCYQLGVFDLIDQYLEKLPIFANRSGHMEILPCFYDDQDATVVLPDAKQFFVDELMEIENPENLHSYRNFGSTSMASKQQVSVGCTEQGQGLNPKRAAASSSEENKDYQLQVFDFIDRYLKALPIFVYDFVYEIIRKEILPYDDLDANKSTVLHSGAKKFIVDEHMEIENPKNLHSYRNFGSTLMAYGQQVSVGCTEQGQGLNKRRAAVGHDSLRPETTRSTMCGKREQHPVMPMKKDKKRKERISRTSSKRE